MTAPPSTKPPRSEHREVVTRPHKHATSKVHHCRAPRRSTAPASPSPISGHILAGIIAAPANHPPPATPGIAISSPNTPRSRRSRAAPNPRPHPEHATGIMRNSPMPALGFWKTPNHGVKACGEDRRRDHGGFRNRITITATSSSLSSGRTRSMSRSQSRRARGGRAPRHATQLRHTVQTVAGGFGQPVGIEHDHTATGSQQRSRCAEYRLSTQQQVVVLVEETACPSRTPATAAGGRSSTAKPHLDV